MRRISDLPLSAVQLVTQYARGRLIAGTNRYAAVCRQWRDAESSSEQLQLFVDLRHMSEAEVDRAFSWMAKHGQQVDVLVLGGSRWQQLPLDLFTRVAPNPDLGRGLPIAPCLSNLTWLVVELRHSLVLLVPGLSQMPQLQHLAVAVVVEQDPEGTRWEDDNLEHDENEPDEVMFINEEGDAWWEPPCLGALCPQLTSFSLRLDCPQSFVTLRWEDQLCSLLPVKLKQLVLKTDRNEDVLLDAGDLWDLKALEQLTLDGLQVASFTQADHSVTGPAALAQQLTALQQLHWYDCSLRDKQTDAVMPLAPKLTGYRQLASKGMRVIQHMPHLTQLKLGLHKAALPQGICDALTGLTGLQELSLNGRFHWGLADVLQQVAGMASLRSLELEGTLDRIFADEVHSALAKCKHLTSLVLLVHVNAPDEDDEDYNDYEDDEPYRLRVPAALTGLRCLTVASGGADGLGVYPVCHTQLTGLCVRLPHDCEAPIWCLWGMAARALQRNQQGQQQQPEEGQPPDPSGHVAIAQGLLGEVMHWPASLQQVLFQVTGLKESDKGGEVAPALWQFTPAAASGGQRMRVWLEEWDGAASGWARPMQRCPHLPGVWELQGRAQGSYSSRWATW